MNDQYYMPPMPMHPFDFALSGLSEEEIRDVELAHELLSTAEKVGYQQFDRARKQLLGCKWGSSARANPVQRVVYHFVEALQERIEKEIGRVSMKGLQRDEETIQGYLNNNLSCLKIGQQLPFTQITQFTGIQAIVDTVALKRKVRLIDVGIRWGVQWIILMQALAERQNCPIELLKITAVESTGNQSIDETGKRLASVAKSLNLPFSFKSVLLSDMKDIKEELFETTKGETLIIYASHILRTMIFRPNCLENLMRVLKNLNPSIMIVTDVEANHNSPLFVDRFIEALFFHSAHYDCVETCMKQNDEDRMAMETLFGIGIRNIIAEEGIERTNRSVKMDVWRAFFARYRMVEIEFSESSLYQASLVVKRFPWWSSCTLDKNGRCLIVGWKGTPIHFLSAWKFL